MFIFAQCVVTSNSKCIFDNCKHHFLKSLKLYLVLGIVGFQKLLFPTFGLIFLVFVSKNDDLVLTYLFWSPVSPQWVFWYNINGISHQVELDCSLCTLSIVPLWLLLTLLLSDPAATAGGSCSLWIDKSCYESSSSQQLEVQTVQVPTKWVVMNFHREGEQTLF